MSERTPRRRAWRVPVAIAAAAVLGVTVFSLADASLQTNDSLSSVLAGVIALVGAFTAVMRWLGEGVKPIDHDQEAALLAGALLRRWKPELEHRAGRGDGRTIPLRWRQREDSVAAPAAEVVGSELRVAVHLDGELSGNLDRAAAELAAGFDGVPNHRLVLLGEPGSGKSFLALALTVGLLRSRVAGKRVPVLLSLASWDPVVQSLDAWMVRSLAEENYAGGGAVPAALLAAGLMLPVLDGLDELPEHVRRRAVGRINDTLRGPRPMVLTCRSADYSGVLAAGAPVVLRAPVVQVQPLTPEDVARHLRNADDRPASWTAVLDHLETHANSPLITALSTPLMLSLFTSGFRTTDPALLLSDPELDNRLAVEDRLIDVLVDSLDESTPGESRRWLTYLAKQSHAHKTPNLSWWRLTKWSPPLAEYAAILLAAPILGLAAAVAAPALATTEPSLLDIVPSMPWLVGAGAFFALLIASFDTGHLPASAPREPGVARRRFVRTLAASNVVAVALGAGVAVLIGMAGDANAEVTTGVGALIGIAAGMGLVIGFGVGLHGYWAARGHRLAVTTPRDLLRHERSSSLVAAAVVAMVVGVGTLPAAVWGGTVGGHLGQQLAQWRGQPVVLDRGFPGTPAHVPWVVDGAHLPALIWVSVLVGLAGGGAALLARPWAQFGFTRVNLSVTRRLPLRLMAFFERAHEHELLRVSGGSYQFWHIRLRERLVATAGPEPASGKLRKGWPAITSGVVSVAAIAALIMVGIAQPRSCPSTGIGELDRVTSRVAAGPASACLGLVSDAAVLGLPPGGTGSVETYLVVGEFDRMTPRQRAELSVKPGDSGVTVTYIELVDPIPSPDVVPMLAGEVLAATSDEYRARVTVGLVSGMTALVEENGQVRVTQWRLPPSSSR
ncbi:hypothetical protein OG439_07590 [Amycolatopsis sp. NBC_01307]|uniref:NACHT domain-containing protein n=1 Tax=Amycolatopsis sp. NBC_01307 TaxID=2903561 RepID=UPI002E0F5F07|nr:hypothetical protein OG439_07590 [Amycolatopsis sp. NBC_01307]